MIDQNLVRFQVPESMRNTFQEDYSVYALLLVIASNGAALSIQTCHGLFILFVLRGFKLYWIVYVEKLCATREVWLGNCK